MVSINVFWLLGFEYDLFGSLGFDGSANQQDHLITGGTQIFKGSHFFRIRQP